jgi:dTDP-4-amino-4,6-dideoxygalactose transaminase
MAPYVEGVGALPVTEQIAVTNIALPISPVLTADQAREVVAVLATVA